MQSLHLPELSSLTLCCTKPLSTNPLYNCRYNFCFSDFFSLLNDYKILLKSHVTLLGAKSFFLCVYEVAQLHKDNRVRIVYRHRIWYTMFYICVCMFVELAL